MRLCLDRRSSSRELGSPGCKGGFTTWCSSQCAAAKHPSYKAVLDAPQPSPRKQWFLQRGMVHQPIERCKHNPAVSNDKSTGRCGAACSNKWCVAKHVHHQEQNTASNTHARSITCLDHYAFS